MTESPHCCSAAGPSPDVHHPDCPRNPDAPKGKGVTLTAAEVSLIDEAETHAGVIAARLANEMTDPSEFARPTSDGNHQNTDGVWSEATPIGWTEEHGPLTRLVFWVRGAGHCGKPGRNEFCEPLDVGTASILARKSCHCPVYPVPHSHPRGDYSPALTEEADGD